MASNYKPHERKKRETKFGAIQKQCVIEFSHSDESSSLDSNSRQIIMVGNEKHAA